ncbi:hypothetical protein BJ165DRAFT_102710 [Panaeolus papilionaceus]|nr:hypothetical protein BJ165DRAFT_102710 [Panaeolus papilionaceus]
MSPLMKKSRASSDAIRYPPMNVGRTTHVPTATVPGDPGTLPNGGNAFDAEARQTIHRPQTGDQFASMTPTSSSQAGTSLSSQLYPYHQQAYRHYTQPTQTQTTSPLQHDLPPGAYRPHPGPGYLSSNPYAQLQHPQSAQYSPPINHPYGPPVPPKPITYPHLTSPVIHNVQTPPHVVQNQYFRASTPPQNQVTSPQQASSYLSSTDTAASVLSSFRWC